MKGFLSGCLACAVWLLLVAVTASPAAASLPVPSDRTTYVIRADVSPRTGDRPETISPIGLGPFANGLDTITLRVELNRFTAPVDLYFVIYIPAVDESFIYYTGDNEEPFAVVPSPWKTHVSGGVAESLPHLSNLSASELPDTMYYLGLVAVPAGSTPASPAAYYLWVTQFEVSGRSLTLVSNCSNEIWAAGMGNNATKSCTKKDEKNSAECSGFDCKGMVCTDFACTSNANCAEPNSYCSELSKSNDTSCAGNANVCGTNKFCGPANKLCSWRSCTYVPLPVTASDIIEPQKACTKNADCCTGSSCNRFCYVMRGDTGVCATVPPADRGNFWRMAPGNVKSQTLTMSVPTPWGGRFWPRTGCQTVGTTCPDLRCSVDSQCQADDKKRVCVKTDATIQYGAACTQSSQCSSALNEFCPAAKKPVPGLTDKTCDPHKPVSSECGTYGPGYECIEWAAGSGNYKCGYWKQCTSYACSASNNCDPQFQCDTGTCTNAAGKKARSCVNSGTESPTVAEVFMRSFSDGSDFYDVSMVDGGNVPVQLSPDPETYDMATSDAVRSPESKATCSTDADCIVKNTDGTKDTSWVCSTRNDGTKGKCINRLVCGGPGCVSDCAKYGFGLTGKSMWGGRNLAITQKDCPASLEIMAGATYVGCMTPKDACNHGTSFQRDTLMCGKSAKSQQPTQGTDAYKNLFQCDGDYATSCYSAGATSSCCGCPDWSFQGGKGCANSNPLWTTKLGPAGTTPEALYKVFNTASPSSYTFPFDDKTALFTCKGRNKDLGVNYTITFCPK